MSPRQYPATKGKSADKLAKLPHFADGGFIDGMRAKLFGPDETVTQKYARQDAERAAKAPAPAPAPPASPAAGLGMITNYAGMTAVQRREKDAGMKDGGPIKGPGTGTSDSIPIMASKGEYMLPADTTKALGGAKVLDKIVASTHTPTGKPAIKRGMMARADGGKIEEKRQRRIAEIPTGGTPQVVGGERIDGTEIGRQTQNSLNALGGMGVVASVPLRAAQRAMSAAPVLPNAMPRLGAPAANATNFVAGMGSGAQVAAAPVTAAAQAIPRLPVVNAALQEGAQANALAGVTRGVSNAGALLTGSEQAQGATPVAPVSTTPAAPSEYGQQMSAVGNFFADGVAAAAKTLASAPGYGFNQTATKAPSASPVPQVPGSAAGAGRGTAPRPDLLGNPGSIPQQAKDMGAVDARQALATLPGVTAPAEPVPGQVTATRQPNGVTSFSGAPNIGMNGGANTYVGDAAKRMGGGFGVNTVQGMSRQEIDQTLGGLSASQVSSDNAIRAANLRDGIDVNWGTAAGQATEAARQQQLLASSPLGTPGRAFAQKQLLANASDATTRRGQDMTNASAQARLGMEKTSFDRAGKGIDLDNQAKAQIQTAQTAFANAKTPAEKVAAEETLRALQGRYEKEQPNRFTPVAGGQEIDSASGFLVTRPERVFNNQTGQFVEQGQSKPALPPNAGAIAMLKSNPKMAADFDAKYGQGAAARSLGQK